MGFWGVNAFLEREQYGPCSWIVGEAFAERYPRTSLPKSKRAGGQKICRIPRVCRRVLLAIGGQLLYHSSHLVGRDTPIYCLSNLFYSHKDHIEDIEGNLVPRRRCSGKGSHKLTKAWCIPVGLQMVPDNSIDILQLTPLTYKGMKYFVRYVLED